MLEQLNLKLPPEVLADWRARASAEGCSVRDWLLVITGSQARPKVDIGTKVSESKKSRNELARNRVKAWRAANPEKVQQQNRVHGSIRRARKSNAIDPLNRVTAAVIASRIMLFDGACAYCGNSGSIHIDHVKPLARGGLHVPKNLVPACQRCNLSKNDSFLEDWYPRQQFFSAERWETLDARTDFHGSVARQVRAKATTQKKYRKMNQKDTLELIRLRSSGMTIRQIASVTGIPKSSVSLQLSRFAAEIAA